MSIIVLVGFGLLSGGVRTGNKGKTARVSSFGRQIGIIFRTVAGSGRGSQKTREACFEIVDAWEAVTSRNLDIGSSTRGGKRYGGMLKRKA